MCEVPDFRKIWSEELLYVNGCEYKRPDISIATELMNVCQNGENELMCSEISWQLMIMYNRKITLQVVIISYLIFMT